MPLYEYKCQKCRSVYERLYSVKDAPRVDECAWGDTNGYYDPGLGSWVSNSQDRERKMKEMGVVPLADYGTHYIDDRLDKEDQQMIQQEKDSQEVRRLESEGVSRGEAFAQVYSTERMAADGLLPDDIKG